MRSAVMILALLMVLGAVFFFVVLRDRPAMYADEASLQAATRPASRSVVPSTVAMMHPEDSLVGPSAGVWIQSLDHQTGLVAKEFNFERLDPRPDNNADVTQPRARFYNDNGSIITLEGTDGVVAYTQGGDHSDPKAAGNATPDHGVFRHVTIRVYDRSLDDAPSTTAYLPAVRFDANDNRIATVDTVIDGKGVLADQVPVKVRGDDYEFDGRGLTMRWNDRDGRLEDLVIKHGERLLIRDVNKFYASERTPAPATAPAAPLVAPPAPLPLSATPAFGVSDLFDGLVMAQPTTDHVTKASQRRASERAAAAATREAAAAPLTTKPATRRVKGQTLYYAHFERDVRVYRSGVLVATSDVMNAVLPSGGEKPTTSPADADAPVAAASDAPLVMTVMAPLPPPTRVPTKTSGKHAVPATRPVRPLRQPVTKPIRPAPATNRSASSKPAEPLEIFWTGTLTVRPVTPETMPVGGGKMVEFIGSPAHVSQDLSSIDARLIHVEPDAGLARVEPGGDVKLITLHLGESTVLHSPDALLYDRDAGLATIEGPGTMVTSDAASTRPSTTRSSTRPTPSTQRAPTTVAWDKRLEVRLENFGDDPEAPEWVDQISLEGRASVVADTFAMNGDLLTFDFDEPDQVPTSKANDGNSMLATPDAKFLRFADSEGHARVATGAADDRRTLVGETIELGVENSNNVAALTSIVADENVALIDARGTELTCDHLDVGVEPIALASATTRATSGPASRPTTNPATRPTDRDAFALIDKLHATGSIILQQADGSTATGDMLTLNKLDGRKTVALDGAPATAGSARSTVSAARLVLDPATNDVDVPGPGKLVSSDPDKPDSVGTVTWIDSMDFTNATAHVGIHGGVIIDNLDETGSAMHATSDEVTLVLASVPTTKPTTRATTRPTATTLAMARPTTAPSFNSISSALLDGNVNITVATTDYRHANVQTATLFIDVANNVVTADKPGRMLILDQRNDPATRPTSLPATQPTTEPTTQLTTQPTTIPTSGPTPIAVTQPVGLATALPATEPTSMPSSQPTTGPTTKRVKLSTEYPTSLAVQWKDKLRWDLLPGTMRLTGGVRVGYERGVVSGPVHIASDNMDATLAPIDLRAGKSGPDGIAPQFDLKTIHAFDNVYVRSRQSSFDAATLDYNLASDLAHASGNADRNVTVFDATGASHVGFSRITWNVQTGAITDFHDITGLIRR